MGTPRIDRLEYNKIINGNFDFWQRGVSFTSIAGGAYSADRFKYNKSGAMVHDVARSTDVPNESSNYSYFLDCTTADASIAAGDASSIGYIIEGNDFLPLAGKKITLSFWVKATKTGVHCVAFRNAAADRSIIKEYTVDSANTWEEKTITLEHNISGTWDYTAGAGLRIDWVLAAGTTFQTTPDTWQGGNFLATSNQVNACDNIANDFRLSQVMLNEGEVAGEFSRAGKTIAEELTMCQRYYEKSYNLDLAPGSVATGGWRFKNHQSTIIGDQRYPRVEFTVRKRANPTVDTWSENGVANDSTRHGPDTDLGAGSSDTIATHEVGFDCRNTGGAKTVDASLLILKFHWTADAEL